METQLTQTVSSEDWLLVVSRYLAMQAELPTLGADWWNNPGPFGHNNPDAANIWDNIEDVFPGLTNQQWDAINEVVDATLDGLAEAGITNLSDVQVALWASFSAEYQDQTGTSLSLVQTVSGDNTYASDLLTHIASDIFDQNSLGGFLGDGAWAQAWAIYSDGQLLNEGVYIFEYGEYQPAVYIPVFTDSTIDAI